MSDGSSDGDGSETARESVLDQASREQLVFHYNREHRLAHAPEPVQRAYREGFAPKAGFFRGLTANAGLRSVFFTIILLSVAVVMLTVFSDRPDSANLNGVTVSVKAFPYEESLFVAVSFSAVSANSREPALAGATIEALSADGIALATQTLSARYTGEPCVLRAKMPDYETSTVVARVSLGATTATIRAQVDRN